MDENVIIITVNKNKTISQATYYEDHFVGLRVNPYTNECNDADGDNNNVNTCIVRVQSSSTSAWQWQVVIERILGGPKPGPAFAQNWLQLKSRLRNNIHPKMFIVTILFLPLFFVSYISGLFLPYVSTKHFSVSARAFTWWCSKPNENMNYLLKASLGARDGAAKQQWLRTKKQMSFALQYQHKIYIDAVWRAWKKSATYL